MARKANDYARARDLYILAVRLDPTNAAAIQGRNDMLAYLGQTEDMAERPNISIDGPSPIVFDFNAALSNLDDDLTGGDLAGRGQNHDRVVPGPPCQNGKQAKGMLRVQSVA